MCALCFLMFVLSFCKKDVFFGTLSCFKSEQNSIRIPLFFFLSLILFYFSSFFCMMSLSIALDNQLRQKEKKKEKKLVVAHLTV